MSMSKEMTGIQNLLKKFEEGDPSLMLFVADDIDLTIDHYKDDVDVAWQKCHNKQQFSEVLRRLGEEVFPQGTRIISMSTSDLGDGWFTTQITQKFWYGLWSQQVKSQSIIISHESRQVVDYFRETVQSVEAIN